MINKKTPLKNGNTDYIGKKEYDKATLTLKHRIRKSNQEGAAFKKSQSE